MNNYQWQKISEIMSKGLDRTFLEFGVRKQDLELLQSLAEKHAIPVELVEDLLRNYNKEEAQNDAVDEKQFVRDLEKLIQKYAR